MRNKHSSILFSFLFLLTLEWLFERWNVFTWTQNRQNESLLGEISHLEVVSVVWSIFLSSVEQLIQQSNTSLTDDGNLNGFTPVLLLSSSVFIGPLDSLFIHAVTESYNLFSPLADGVIFGIDLIGWSAFVAYGCSISFDPITHSTQIFSMSNNIWQFGWAASHTSLPH